MCLFWWNTDIYLCGTSKTIASFSTANWINAPSGCWARSRAENCIFCYAAALCGRIHFAIICSAFTFPVHSQTSFRKPTHTTKKKIELGDFFFSSTNPPLVSLRALILVVLCPSMNCWANYPDAKYRSHLEFLPMLRDICLWDFHSGHLSLQSVKQRSILLSDPTQSKPFAKKS